MALAIDVSTPALGTANSGNVASTGSFTPPAGAVLVAVAYHDTVGGNTTNTSIVTDSQTLAWTIRATRNRADAGGQNGQVQISTAVVGSSTAMTVTTTGTNCGGAAGIYVLVMTGADTTTPMDATPTEGSNTAGVISLAITTVTDLAWCFLAATDWNVAANMTAGTSQTAVVSTGIGAGPDMRVYVGRQNAVTSPAGAVTMSTASPTSGNTNNYIVFAVRPAAGGSSTNAPAENATGTGAANAATIDAAAAAGATTATGASNDAAAAVAPSAEVSTGSGAAFDATVSTAAQTSANAENAAATGTANSAAIATAVNADVGTATGTANDAAASAGPAAGATSGTGSAADATTALAGNAEHAAATGTAFDASISITAAAELITAIAAAFAATTTAGAADVKATSASAVTAGRTSTSTVTARRTSVPAVTAKATSTGGVT